MWPAYDHSRQRLLGREKACRHPWYVEPTHNLSTAEETHISQHHAAVFKLSPKLYSMTTVESKPRRWYHWFHPDDSPEERKLIVKLDLLIVIYAFVVYWVKYLDQANISEPSSSTLMSRISTKYPQIMPTSLDSPRILASTATSSCTFKRCTAWAQSWDRSRSHSSSQRFG